MNHTANIPGYVSYFVYALIILAGIYVIHEELVRAHAEKSLWCRNASYAIYDVRLDKCMGYNKAYTDNNSWVKKVRG